MAAAIGLGTPALAGAQTAKKASGGTAAASLATTPEGTTATEGATTPPATESPSPTTVGGTTTSTGTTTTSTGHHAPVTARHPKLSYKGPVYEKTAAGQIVPYAPAPVAGASSSGSPTGGSAASTAAGEVLGTGKPDLLVPGSTARYVDGLAAAPMSAPEDIQQIIWAGNQIVGLPYIWGGGHASFVSPGYDCSGTVSFALHGAQLISTPMDSSEFMHWGEGGDGRWVTVFTNPEHAYMTVAGLRLDTSPVDDPSNRQGPRWRPLRPGNPGFWVRHPAGL